MAKDRLPNAEIILDASSSQRIRLSPSVTTMEICMELSNRVESELYRQDMNSTIPARKHITDPVPDGAHPPSFAWPLRSPSENSQNAASGFEPGVGVRLTLINLPERVSDSFTAQVSLYLLTSYTITALWESELSKPQGCINSDGI